MSREEDSGMLLLMRMRSLPESKKQLRCKPSVRGKLEKRNSFE